MSLNENFSFNEDLSSGSNNSKNLLIKGDNQKVLPELIKYYSEKIKCIYIDPPYNNGDVYHFYNDKTSHAEWVTNLHRTLQLLKTLLHKNGSIWISIDDKEMAYLKIEADKIFGRENFVGTIVWQQRKTRENRAVLSNNHEYILVYAKEYKSFKKTRNLLSVNKEFVSSKYKNMDGDPRGPWQSITASVQAGHAVKSQFYTIVSPNGTKHNPPKGRCWVYNKERMTREIAQNNIWFGKSGKNVPRIKKFLTTAKIGLTPESLWIGDDVGTTDSAKKHLLQIFKKDEKIFDTPKPEQLIKRIIDISTKEGDYVLDCFLGSGTTIAVAHKTKRNYIGVEIGDQISDLVVKRLNMVINGESGGISNQVGWRGGGEFAFFDFISSKKEKENVPIVEIKPPRIRSSSQISFVSMLHEKRAKYSAKKKSGKKRR